MGRVIELRTPILIPRYLDRPAFVLLISVLLGLVAFNSSQLLHWCLVYSVCGITLLALSYFLSQREKKIQTAEKDTLIEGGILENSTVQTTENTDLLEQYSKATESVHRFIPKTLSSWGLVLIFASIFSLFAAERSHEALLFPKELTLDAQQVHILYPIKSSSNSLVKYHGEWEYKGQKLNVLLHIPDQFLPDNGYNVTIEGHLQLSALTASDSYHRYLLSEGYHAMGQITDFHFIKKEFGISPLILLKRFREKMVRSFEKQTQQLLSPDERGLIIALSIGDRSRLSSLERDHFTSAGVAHVMAVSGYHLGVVYALILLLFRRFLYRIEDRGPRNLLIIFTLLLYTLLSGASIATVRAWTMSAILLLTSLFGKRTDTVQSLSLTAILLLIWQPLSYMSVGLVLSLVAVWGILTFLPLFQWSFNTKYRIISSFRDAFFVTISAQLALLPLLFYYFGKVQLSIIWSNIPIVFLSGIIIPVGLILLLLTPIVGKFIPDICYYLLGNLSKCMMTLTGYFGEGTHALEIKGDWDLVQVLLYYIILLLLYRIAVRLLNKRYSYPMI